MLPLTENNLKDHEKKTAVSNPKNASLSMRKRNSNTILSITRMFLSF